MSEYLPHAYAPLREWLARQEAPTLDQVRADIEATLAELVEVDRMLRDAHTLLGRYPEQHHEAQEVLEQLRSHRALTVEHLGHAVAWWTREGGRLELHSPSGLPRPVSPPVPLGSSPVPFDGVHDQVAENIPGPPGRGETGTSSPKTEAAEPSSLLSELLTILGPPRDLSDTLGLLDEVEALEALCAPAMMARWPLLPKVAQRALLAMAVARTRAVKDRPNLSPGVRERLKVVIATFPAYAKRHSPGYVNGLQLSHDPQGISWRADGLTYWDELRRLAGDTT